MLNRISISMALLRYVKLFSLFIALVLIQSCEYETPEKVTYVNPDSTSPALTELALDLNTDILSVCGLTRFNFSLISSDQSIMVVVVNCLGKTFTTEGPSGYFEVDPTTFPDGEYKVQMDVYTHSGTGSLADKIGSEGYLFTREWILKIQRPSFIKVKFLDSSVENGFLKIQWQKLELPYFQYYKIIATDSSLNHSFTKIIYDVNSTSLIDSSFVGGKAEFTLMVAFNQCEDPSKEYFSDKLIYRYPAYITFDERADSMTINWTNLPFNHTVYLTSNMFSTRLDLGKSKSYTMRSPGLGNEVRYEISFKPTVKLTWDHQMYNVYINYTIGTKTGMNFYRMVCVPELNALFLKHPMFFRKYNSTSIERLLSYDYSWDYYDNTTIAISPDKTKAFTTVNQNILQFNSATFDIISKKKFGPSETGSRTFYQMHILNDSLMYIAYSSSLAIYNYNSRSIIDATVLLKSSGEPYNITVSKDGRYVANCSDGSLKVYRNTDNLHLELIYETTGNFLECIFDPVNIYNLLLITNEKAYVVQCPDMELLYTIPSTIRGMAVNFDPVTNYLLFVSYSSKTVTVYDYEHNTVMFKCLHHDYFTAFYLANNTIYHSSGYTMNTNYIFNAK